MADSGQTPQKLVDNIIDFINSDRELYGGFQMGGHPGDKDTGEANEQPDPEHTMNSDSNGGGSAREKPAESGPAGDEVSKIGRAAGRGSTGSSRDEAAGQAGRS